MAMYKKIKRIAILTTGGDSPGMNAGIRAVVRVALANQVEVLGARSGFKGLVENDFIPLDQGSVANCIQRGGTILKTTRYPEFKQESVRVKAAANLRQHGIEAIIVLGGDGSFRAAKILSKEHGIRTVGIPCTIDNDIVGTDYSIGFDTACNTALEAIDKIRDTAFSHDNNFLVEVMGRSSGFLAVNVGIAGGAEFILIPEVDCSAEDLLKQIQQRRRLKMGSIIVVAEADEPGRSFKIAKTINTRLKKSYRVCVLGHTQRGGVPTVRERKIASLMGYYAVTALLDGKDQVMIGYRQDRCECMPFPDVQLGPRRVKDTTIFTINNILCGL